MVETSAVSTPDQMVVSEPEETTEVVPTASSQLDQLQNKVSWLDRAALRVPMVNRVRGMLGRGRISEAIQIEANQILEENGDIWRMDAAQSLLEIEENSSDATFLHAVENTVDDSLRTALADREAGHISHNAFLRRVVESTGRQLTLEEVRSMINDADDAGELLAQMEENGEIPSDQLADRHEQWTEARSVRKAVEQLTLQQMHEVAEVIMGDVSLFKKAESLRQSGELVQLAESLSQTEHFALLRVVDAGDFTPDQLTEITDMVLAQREAAAGAEIQTRPTDELLAFDNVDQVLTQMIEASGIDADFDNGRFKHRLMAELGVTQGIDLETNEKKFFFSEDSILRAKMLNQDLDAALTASIAQDIEANNPEAAINLFQKLQGKVQLEATMQACQAAEDRAAIMVQARQQEAIYQAQNQQDRAAAIAEWRQHPRRNLMRSIGTFATRTAGAIHNRWNNSRIGNAVNIMVRNERDHLVQGYQDARADVINRTNQAGEAVSQTVDRINTAANNAADQINQTVEAAQQQAAQTVDTINTGLNNAADQINQRVRGIEEQVVQARQSAEQGINRRIAAVEQHIDSTLARVRETKQSIVNWIGGVVIGTDRMAKLRLLDDIDTTQLEQIKAQLQQNTSQS